MEVGKIFFAASSVKKMSRFEEVSPEEIKRIVDNATPINTQRSTKYGLKIFIGKCVLNVIKYLLVYLKDSNAASHFVNSLILFALSRTA